MKGLTTIANLAVLDDVIRSQGSVIWRNTFRQAQMYNLQMQKELDGEKLPCSYYGSGSWPGIPLGAPRPQAKKTNGFLNDYYDDEGWWALAW